MGTLVPQSNGPLYSNTVISTLEGPGRATAHPDPSSLYHMQQPTHQRPAYQLHIIRCSTIIAFALVKR